MSFGELGELGELGEPGELGRPDDCFGLGSAPSTESRALTLVPASQLVTPRDESDARALLRAQGLSGEHADRLLEPVLAGRLLLLRKAASPEEDELDQIVDRAPLLTSLATKEGGSA